MHKISPSGFNPPLFREPLHMRSGDSSSGGPLAGQKVLTIFNQFISEMEATMEVTAQKVMFDKQLYLEATVRMRDSCQAIINAIESFDQVPDCVNMLDSECSSSAPPPNTPEPDVVEQLPPPERKPKSKSFKELRDSGKLLAQKKGKVAETLPELPQGKSKNNMMVERGGEKQIVSDPSLVNVHPLSDKIKNFNVRKSIRLFINREIYSGKYKRQDAHVVLAPKIDQKHIFAMDSDEVEAVFVSRDALEISIYNGNVYNSRNISRYDVDNIVWHAIKQQMEYDDIMYLCHLQTICKIWLNVNECDDPLYAFVFSMACLDTYYRVNCNLFNKVVDKHYFHKYIKNNIFFIPVSMRSEMCLGDFKYSFKSSHTELFLDKIFAAYQSRHEIINEPVRWLFDLICDDTRRVLKLFNEVLHTEKDFRFTSDFPKEQAIKFIDANVTQIFHPNFKVFSFGIEPNNKIRFRRPRRIVEATTLPGLVEWWRTVREPEEDLHMSVIADNIFKDDHYSRTMFNLIIELVDDFMLTGDIANSLMRLWAEKKLHADINLLNCFLYLRSATFINPRTKFFEDRFEKLKGFEMSQYHCKNFLDNIEGQKSFNFFNSKLKDTPQFYQYCRLLEASNDLKLKAVRFFTGYDVSSYFNCNWDLSVLVPKFICKYASYDEPCGLSEMIESFGNRFGYGAVKGSMEYVKSTLVSDIVDSVKMVKSSDLNPEAKAEMKGVVDSLGGLVRTLVPGVEAMITDMLNKIWSIFGWPAMEIPKGVKVGKVITAFIVWQRMRTLDPIGVMSLIYMMFEDPNPIVTVFKLVKDILFNSYEVALEFVTNKLDVLNHVCDGCMMCKFFKGFFSADKKDATCAGDKIFKDEMQEKIDRQITVDYRENSDLDSWFNDNICPEEETEIEPPEDQPPVEEQPKETWMCWLASQWTKQSKIALGILGTGILISLGVRSGVKKIIKEDFGSGVVEVLKNFHWISLGIAAVPKIYQSLIAAIYWAVEKYREWANPNEPTTKSKVERAGKWLKETVCIQKGFIERSFVQNARTGLWYERQVIEGMSIMADRMSFDATLRIAVENNFKRIMSVRSVMDSLMNVWVGRYEPVHFQFCGEPGIGKTNIYQNLVEDHSALLSIPSEIYPLNPELNHFDDYYDQRVCLIDDVKIMKEEENYYQMILLIGGAPLVVPMAAVEDKGKTVRFRLIYSNTNNPWFKPMNVIDDKAYQRRRHLVRVTINPNNYGAKQEEITGTNNKYLQNMLFTVLKPTSENETPVHPGLVNMTWKNFKRWSDVIVKQHAVRERERALANGQLHIREAYEQYVKEVNTVISRAESMRSPNDMFAELLKNVRAYSKELHDMGGLVDTHNSSENIGYYKAASEHIASCGNSEEFPQAPSANVDEAVSDGPCEENPFESRFWTEEQGTAWFRVGTPAWEKLMSMLKEQVLKPSTSEEKKDAPEYRYKLKNCFNLGEDVYFTRGGLLRDDEFDVSIVNPENIYIGSSDKCGLDQMLGVNRKLKGYYPRAEGDLCFCIARRGKSLSVIQVGYHIGRLEEIGANVQHNIMVNTDILDYIKNWDADRSKMNKTAFRDRLISLQNQDIKAVEKAKCIYKNLIKGSLFKVADIIDTALRFVYKYALQIQLVIHTLLFISSIIICILVIREALNPVEPTVYHQTGRTYRATVVNDGMTWEDGVYNLAEKCSYSFKMSWPGGYSTFSGVGIKGNCFLINRHSIAKVPKRVPVLIEIDDPLHNSWQKKNATDIKETAYVTLETDFTPIPKKDAGILVIKTFRSVKDISNQFIHAKALDSGLWKEATGWSMSYSDCKYTHCQFTDSVLLSNYLYSDKYGSDYLNQIALKFNMFINATVPTHSGSIVGHHFRGLPPLLGIVGARSRGADRPHTIVVVVTREELEKAFENIAFEDKITIESASVEPVNLDYVDPILPSTVLGAYEITLHCPETTEMIPTPLNAAGLMANKTQPAILSNKDPRWKEVLEGPHVYDHFFQKGLNKYAAPSTGINFIKFKQCALELARADADWLRNIRFWSVNESIVGTSDPASVPLNLNNASGLPYLHLSQKKGKTGFISVENGKAHLHNELTRRLKELDKGCRSGVYPERYVKVFPKDEDLPLRKIPDGPRSILVSPLDVVVYAGQLYGSIMLACKRTPVWRSHTIIGSNMESSDFHMYADYLYFHDNIIAFDVKNWDGSISLGMLRGAAEYICEAYRLASIYQGMPIDPTLLQAIHTEIVGTSESYLVYKNIVYLVRMGIKSGLRTTLYLNSLIHKIIGYYIYKDICEAHNRYDLANVGSYDKIVRKVYCGDDVIRAVDPQYADLFNPQNFADGYKSIGFNVTNADKTEVTDTWDNFQNAEFVKLSGRFCEEMGRWVMAPNTSIIHGLLCWQNSKIPKIEQFNSNILVASRFAFWLGRKYYEQFCEEVLALLTKIKHPYAFLSYDCMRGWVQREILLSRAISVDVEEPKLLISNIS